MNKISTLTPRDRRRYEELKKLISSSLWDAVGYAAEIQEKKLYLEEYRTFDDFIKAELGYSKSRFYQLLEANEGRKRLSQVAQKSTLVDSAKDKVDDLSVNAARVIGRANEKDVQEIFDTAVEIAQETDSPLSARILKDAADEVAAKKTSIPAFDNSGYEDVEPVTAPEPPKPSIKEQVSKLRSIALQHYKAAMRAVDDMNQLKKDKANHAIVEAQNVVIQEAVREGWK